MDRYRLLGSRRSTEQDFLVAAARVSRPRWHCLIGADMCAILAICDGLEQGIDDERRLVEPAEWHDWSVQDRLWVFHWQGGRKAARAIEGKLKSKEMMMIGMQPSPVRAMEAGQGRDGWRRGVGYALRGHAPEPTFGMWVHCGEGRRSDIRGDLAVFAPLIDDRTLLVLRGLDRLGPAEAFEYLATHEGWEGVRLGTLGLLQRPAHPKERQDASENV